jgi:hypothetical protein
VAIAGTHFLRDGRPWVPRGVGLTGLVLVDSLVDSGRGRPQLIASHNMFGLPLLHAIRDFGADAVRVAVSQPGLNPSDRLFDPHYADETVQKIELIRRAGFVVVVTMQWERGAGPSPRSGLTDDPGTLAAWRSLIAVLPLADHGIILEPLNEPNYRYQQGAPPDAAMWAAWRPGMQDLVTSMRGLGWTGVMLLDGVYGSSWIDGAPPIADTLRPSQLGWSVHVYFTKPFIFQSPQDWEPRFGAKCDVAACMVTEFQDSLASGCTRRGNNRVLAEDFLRYLRRKGLGVFPWAFDYRNTVMVGNSLTDMTRYPDTPFCSGDKLDDMHVFGSGQMIHDYFLGSGP